MISVSGIEKSFGDRTLFAGASFQLNAGQRYGLVGANGSGKTTFLNVLGGYVEADRGSVSIPKRLRVGTLRQDQFLYGDDSVISVAMMGNRELWDAMVEKDEILARAEDDFDMDRFGELEELVQLHDGYTAEARAATILEGLGLPTEVHAQPLSTLSGGFKLRVLLAQVLASNPDVLFLDEPTNHLDILSIRWLEKFMRDFAGPLVVISHDHRFLDNVATDILDVDYGTVTLYRGNYTAFLGGKQEERQRREKEIASQEREIAELRGFVDRFRAKASKARQAQSKLRIIEKKSNSIVALPGSSRRYPNFRFEQVRPSGQEVLRVSGVTKSFGDNEVLKGVDLEVRRGDRIAIIGPNGIGKSTLLKIWMGQLEADAGEVTWGYETYPGYFAQDHKTDFDGVGQSAEDWLWTYCAGRDRGYVRGQMGLMLFSGDDGEKPLSSLSGGEAARLVFSRLAVEKPNVLVLDEPTNHLDLESIEALVAGLNAFDGTVVLVSHDRWFVGEVATRIVEIRPDGIRDYLGTYAEYVHACGDDHLDADAVVLKARTEKRKSRQGQEGKGSKKKRRGRDNGGRPPEPKKPPPNRSRLEKERDDLTGRIEGAEERMAVIDARFCEAGFYEETPPDTVAALEGERAALQSEVGRLMTEWEGKERELERLN